MKKICKHCGGEFETKAHNAKYCSKICASKAQNKRKSHRRKLKRKDIYCRFCGKRLIAKSSTKRYCNSSCQYKHYFENPEFRQKRKDYEKKRINTPERKEYMRNNAKKNYKKRKDEKKLEKLRNSLTRSNLIEKLREVGQLEKVCFKAHVPSFYLEKYGVNSIQFEKMLTYVT